MAEEKKTTTDELIDYRLKQIELKLDQVTNLLLQAQAQEIRINNLENTVKEIKSERKKYTEIWLTPLISTLVSGLVAFILVKVGIK